MNAPGKHRSRNNLGRGSSGEKAAKSDNVKKNNPKSRELPNKQDVARARKRNIAVEKEKRKRQEEEERQRKEEVEKELIKQMILRVEVQSILQNRFLQRLTYVHALPTGPDSQSFCPLRRGRFMIYRQHLQYMKIEYYTFGPLHNS